MISFKTMSQSVPWQMRIWNIHLSMLLSARRINDAGILPGFSMPGSIWHMNASQRKHNENMQLQPSFVSHKLWNFPEAGELDTNRAICLSGQVGRTQTCMTETPSVCLELQVTDGCELHLTLENNSSRSCPFSFLTWNLPPSFEMMVLGRLGHCCIGYICFIYTFTLLIWLASTVWAKPELLLRKRKHFLVKKLFLKRPPTRT